MIAYLDNSATTKPCAQAVEAMTEMLTRCWGNPSAVHSMGIEAEQKLRWARNEVAKALGTEAGRVFFTSGGTEADNWAIFSAAERHQKKGKHLVTTAVEHHAVLHPMKKLEERGFDVTYLPPDAQGFVSVEALSSALRADTILVSVMMVNNETGTVMPIADMVRAVRRKCPISLFHTDAVQGFMKVPFQAARLGADLITVSSHKIHGPKGAGALYIREGLLLPPYLYGGGQERNFRSGTEALPAIVGFGAACAASDPVADIARMTTLRDACRAALQAIPGVQLLGRGDAPHIICIAVPGIRSQGLINCLQDNGVFVSAGSACAKGHRSHVLKAMKLGPAVMDGSLRISLGRENTADDIRRLCDTLSAAIKQLKG